MCVFLHSESLPVLVIQEQKASAPSRFLSQLHVFTSFLESLDHSARLSAGNRQKELLLSAQGTLRGDWKWDFYSGVRVGKVHFRAHFQCCLEKAPLLCHFSTDCFSPRGQQLVRDLPSIPPTCKGGYEGLPAREAPLPW